MSKIPVVAIVGRANVGKSSIFNRFLAKRQAIVAREAGTTRDAVYGRIDTGKGLYLVADTAGLKNPDDEFEASIQDQINDATNNADCLIVVVDGTVILSDEDRRVAKLAHKSSTPVILAINKADLGKKIDITEYKKLGINEIVLTSATQNQGIRDLEASVLRHIKPVKQNKKSQTKIALIGRPNVGKSSLFNNLANKQQAIVADLAGTTRDVNRTNISFYGEQFILMDTAGIRRPGRIQTGIENFSVLRAISAIDESDICILVIDATEPGVALDQKLAGIIKDAGKGLILAMTKWDLVDKDAYTHDQMADQLRYEFQHVAWAPFIVTSSTSGQNVSKLMELIKEINIQRGLKLKTPLLNRWLLKCTQHHPPAGLKNKHPKLKYITQIGNHPPEFSIFGTHTSVLHWSYKRYLERELRTEYGFEGTPVIVNFKEKD